MMRWAEFSLANRLAGRNTRFSLVFHTEGLINDNVARLLETFGKDLQNLFRPLLAVITPICPQYMVDPMEDKLRVNFPHQEVNESREMDFEKKIKRLATYYDIGYHGHFFALVGGRHRPAFDNGSISGQFEEECRYLTSLGFRPEVYAGGWWFISSNLISLLQSWRFKLDTSMNDLQLDSFSRPQPYPHEEVGRPYWLAENVLEIPSIRSFANLGKIIVSQRKSANFVVIALHDYDLLSAPSKMLHNLFRKLLKGNRLLSVPQLIEESKIWLHNHGNEKWA